ncbi:hypothetical protein F2Q69_00036313 [Brassica cretica]|uniref:Uncharacterized protein n=1 Tax=Brassica cretica TaxID=69181 RepID=A0A8S9SE87_BRACR|nr:hypothetical protein F2Q69_00036313 [Brassica cretica]
MTGSPPPKHNNPLLKADLARSERCLEVNPRRTTKPHPYNAPHHLSEPTQALDHLTKRNVNYMWPKFLYKLNGRKQSVLPRGPRAGTATAPDP